MADVAVVVGNYQGEALLPDCLESLRTQTLAPAEVHRRRRCARPTRSVAVAAGLGARVIETREPRPRLPLQPRRARRLRRLRPPREQRRRARAGLPRAARRGARRRRDAGSPPTRASSAGTARARSTRARRSAAAGCCASTFPGSISTISSPATRADADGLRARRRDARPPLDDARARRLRRDVLHGVGGPRPLLARLDARLGVRLRPGRRRPPPRRRGDDAERAAAPARPRRTTT